MYWVFGGPTPQWHYTVGLNAGRRVPELLLCGTTVALRDELQAALGALADHARSAATGLRTGTAVEAGALGTVKLAPVHSSWSKHLLLGAVDRYGSREFDVVQVVPTVTFADTPDLSGPYSPHQAGPWRWLTEPWDYALAPESMALTDLSALHGDPITVVNHHRAADDAPWEFFADRGEVDPETLRLVPIGTLVAIDPSLEEVLELEPGTWAEREGASEAWEAFWMP